MILNYYRLVFLSIIIVKSRILYYFFQLYDLPCSKVDDESILPAKFDEDMIDRAVKMFDWTREKSEAKKMEKVKICVNRVKTCLKKRNLVCPIK